MTTTKKTPLVGIVGPCSAGKTTLKQGLEQHGIHAKHIAQEHSYVQDMWQRLTNPDVLIFLEVSYPVAQKRRKLSWTLKEYQIQKKRLENARQHANLLLDTDQLTPDEILKKTLDFLKEISDTSLPLSRQS